MFEQLCFLKGCGPPNVQGPVGVWEMQQCGRGRGRGVGVGDAAVWAWERQRQQWVGGDLEGVQKAQLEL
jgi:hypothetical protein